MLYTRNAFLFRKFFKEKIARETNWLDLNFIGSLHPDKKRTETGFAKLIYGNREDLGKLLGTIALNVAADDQAIYELIQNADDSKSSFFSVNYNEKYLLCMNNGNYFSDNDMSAIINVAGNFKEGEDIGTFGIGFKILHRLVGTDDGRDAIINNYAGPIIFSWKKLLQLEKFLNGEEIRTGYDAEKDKENAWLIKILYTCFPSHFGEKVRLKDYETQETKFDESELNEMREFLKSSLQNVNLQETNNLKNGSIFFLKLGEGKSKFLDDGIEKIKSGLSYSFKFLNSLKKIYINGEEIQEQKVDFYGKSYSIESAEFLKINPKNKKRDIKFTFAFYKDYRKAENLRNGLVPNLYTFFSMDEEKNGLNFLLHCNAFDMNNDRRKLQANSQINENLLPTIANEITQYIEKQKDRNRELFLSLYGDLLLSNEPKSKPHINNFFFTFLKDYLYENIPTQNGYAHNSENVKIKATNLPIQPSDFGCPDIEWFAWQNEKTDKALIDEARNSEKLHLEKWDIVDLLEYAISKGNIEVINDWVKQANERHFADTNNKDYTYLSFVQEIDKNISERDLSIISQIKLFKFSDGDYYSLNEIFANSNLILIYGKTVSIKVELRNLGFITSHLNISHKNKDRDNHIYPNLLKFILPKINEETLFKAIAEKSKDNNLRAEEKHNLFFTIAEFERVGAEKLKDLELFRDSQGSIRPLRTLLKGNLQIPTWLDFFKISPNEYVEKLDTYFVKDEEIYQSIIYENWDFLINQKLNIKDFYTQVTSYYKQTPKNLRLETLPCIFTNQGFKKPNEVFFNPNINFYNLYDLQNAILKISDKSTPSKLIFEFLTDDNSPFKISRNDTVSSFITSNYTLSHSETLAILEFARSNNEKLFSIAYIQKQNDTFLLVKHSQSVFQYNSNRQEINELLSNQPNFKLLPKDFTANDFRELGIWQEKGLYMKVLQNLEFSENLLPIIRESDKEVQLAYLEKLKDFSLQEGKIYDRNSFEHHCLKLAIDCYADDFQTKFAPKILINGKLRIKDIAVKDDINFENITLYLSSVLPDYKGFSDIITKIINQFAEFTKTELSEKVFPINNKKKDEVYSELVTKFPTLQNIEQFAFLLYYSKQSGKNFFTNQLLTALPNVDILQFAYKQKFTELANFLNTGLKDKIYSSELALEPEKLPTWVLTWLESEDKQEKLNFLSALGVHTENSNVCAIRRFFQTGQITDFQGKVFAIEQNSILLINTLKWLQGNTFNTSESIKLDTLKQIYSRINYTHDIPLLYISQITDGETLYNLEVSTAIKKYYFETPQKEYSQKIFTVLQSKGFKLIALDYFKHWQARIQPEKIATTEILDIDKIKQNCKAWNDSAYDSWEAKSKYPIFIYEGDKIPYKIVFHGTDIDTFEKERSKKDGNVIYVSKSVSDIKQELLNEKLVLTDDLLKLYSLNQSNSNEVISVIQEYNLTVAEIQDLIRIKEWFFNRSRPTLEPKTDAEIKAISNISSTGVKGEDIVNQYLISKFGTERVIWASQKGEARYDFEVLTSDKKTVEMYIDAKATITSEYEADKIPILIRTRAWDFLKANKYGNFFIARIFDVNNAKVEDVKLLEIRWRDL